MQTRIRVHPAPGVHLSTTLLMLSGVRIDRKIMVPHKILATMKVFIVFKNNSSPYFRLSWVSLPRGLFSLVAAGGATL